MEEIRLKKVEKLLELCQQAEGVVIVAHDNPDPDSIASGWALMHLIQVKTGKQPTFVARGGILRAENRMMVRLLKPPLQLNESPFDHRNLLVIFVDCLPETVNHEKIDGSHHKIAAIDHHLTKVKNSIRLTYKDLRRNVASTATIIVSYLRSEGVSISQDLATALLYAIRTETKGGESKYHHSDRSAVSWLTPQVNLSHLAQIEDAPLTRGYFGDMVLALQNAFLYDNTIYCYLPKIEAPEIVGEVADLLIRLESAEAVLCLARYGDNVALSARTDRQSLLNATEIITQVLAGIGHGGGHMHRAGGIILGEEHDLERINQATISTIKARWLDALGQSEKRGDRLVTKGDILKNL